VHGGPSASQSIKLHWMTRMWSSMVRACGCCPSVHFAARGAPCSCETRFRLFLRCRITAYFFLAVLFASISAYRRCRLGSTCGNIYLVHAFKPMCAFSMYTHCAGSKHAQALRHQRRPVSYDVPCSIHSLVPSGVEKVHYVGGSLVKPATSHLSRERCALRCYFRHTACSCADSPIPMGMGSQ